MAINLELNLPPEIEKEFNQNPDLYKEDIQQAIIKSVRDRSHLGRLEMVKVITRAKAAVLNWPDLEREIFEGGT